MVAVYHHVLEDYGFEYEDADEELPDVEIENQYYISKESDIDAAIESFNQVVYMETTKGEWGFKALKQCVLLYYKKGDWPKMLSTYQKMLGYIKDAVTRNHSENVITLILDTISQCETIYESTLTALQEAKNETKLKLGNLCFNLGEFGKLTKVLRELHESCATGGAGVDESKGTQILEAYALEIQMYTVKKDQKKLRELYKKSLQIKSAVTHPRIMGIIREMYMAERDWHSATTDFFEAFKNYDESGSPRKIQCLKYLVIANMLTKSDINPFESQEAKPYKSDPHIMTVTDLMTAYEQDDIRKFENILRRNKSAFYDDAFLREYVSELLKNMRSKFVLKYVKPYTRLSIQAIAQELNADPTDVENLVAIMILDGDIDGRIDQISHILLMKGKYVIVQMFGFILGERQVVNMTLSRNGRAGYSR